MFGSFVRIAGKETSPQYPPLGYTDVQDDTSLSHYIRHV